MKMRVQIKKIKKSKKNGYTMAKCMPIDTDIVTGQLYVSGYMPIAVDGDTYDMYGDFDWNTGVFVVNHAVNVLPANNKQVTAYLIKRKVKNAISVAKECDTLVDIAPYIDKAMVELIYHDVVNSLMDAGLSGYIMQNIWSAYSDKNQLQDVINYNPYNLVIKGVDLMFCDAIADIKQIKNSEMRAKGLILQEIYDYCNNGNHFYTPLKYLKDNIDFDINGYLAEIVDEGNIVVEGDNVYPIDNHRCETIITDAIRNRLQLSQQSLIVDIDNDNINDDQRNAIINAVNNNISIITGAAGTGKTHTIKALLSTIGDASVTLIAPTGRAAKRIQEATDHEASTIHKAYAIKKEDDGRYKRLKTDYLIVDEATMIDAKLWSIIFDNTNITTKIVIIGDINQLPAIGTGHVFADMINSNVVPTTVLSTVQRQSNVSQILAVATGIINGEIIDTDNSIGDYYHVQRRNNNAILRDIIESVKRMQLRHTDVQVLCVTKKGELGAENINKLLQNIVNPLSADKESITIGDKTWRVGDKVMQVVNDYDKNIYNGDIGYIIEIIDDIIIVEFGYDEISYDVTTDDMDQIELAYAITIHKAQGSGYDCCIMPIIDSRIMTNNLVYTAITRAVKTMIMIGDKELLSEVINRRIIERKSDIINKISVQIS